MIKVDVKGLIKIENIRIIKKPLNLLTPLIYLTITVFGLCFKVRDARLLSPIIGSRHHAAAGHVHDEFILLKSSFRLILLPLQILLLQTLWPNAEIQT